MPISPSSGNESFILLYQNISFEYSQWYVNSTNSCILTLSSNENKYNGWGRDLIEFSQFTIKLTYFEWQRSLCIRNSMSNGDIVEYDTGRQ